MDLKNYFRYYFFGMGDELLLLPPNHPAHSTRLVGALLARVRAALEIVESERGLRETEGGFR